MPCHWVETSVDSFLLKWPSLFLPCTFPVLFISLAFCLYMMKFPPFPKHAVPFTTLHLEQAVLSAWNASLTLNFLFRTFRMYLVGHQHSKAFAITTVAVNHFLLCVDSTFSLSQHLLGDIMIDLFSCLICPNVWDTAAHPAILFNVRNRVETPCVLWDGELQPWLRQVYLDKN